MKNGIAALLLTLIVAISLTSANAHEAHRKDMSDAEMAEMKLAEKAAHQGAVDTPSSPSKSSTNITAKSTAETHTEMMADHSAAATFSPTDFLGRLHPAMVHFPIALFLIAGLAELILFLRPASGLEQTVRFLIYTGAAGGMSATAVGWLAAGFRMSDRSETLGLHRWTGTGIALAGAFAAIIAYRAKPGRILLRFTLAGIAVALLFQGYWGAEMSLGPNHMGM